MDQPQPRLDLPFTGIPSFLRSRLAPDLASLDADLAVLGVPSDEGSPWKPGSRFGPRAIREQSVRFAGDRSGIFDPDEGRAYLARELAEDRIADCGDVDVLYTNREATFTHVTAAVRQIIERGAVPVVLGGDHGVSFPAIRAWRTPLSVVQFDAHLDVRPPSADLRYTNGTPFALVAGLPHVERIAQVGIRSLRTREGEFEAALRRGNVVRTVRQFRAGGPAELLSHLPPDRDLYVSIDLDVLDLPLVPGCASAEPGGLLFDELRAALSALARHAPVVGFDLVELNPMLDVPSGATALLAAHLVIDLMGRLVEHPAHAARR